MMTPVEALRRALDGADPAGLSFEKIREGYTLESAIWRFLKVWGSNPRIGPDLAVALRQVARWQTQNLFVGKLPPTLAQLGSRAGVEVTPSGHLQATPFAPEWLFDDCNEPIIGIDSRPTVRRFHE